MLQKNRAGVSILIILIFVVIFGLLIGGGFLLINSEKAKTRDAKRLSDMTRIQAAFEFLYNDTASYEGAALGGCGQPGMLVSQCNLTQYLPTLAEFIDPGTYSYTVQKAPDSEGYAVSFMLEKNYGSLRAGPHTLSPEGIF
ncbi:MAG: hypothetical protein WC505_04815 [Patescibacteria group bacterium]